MGPSPVKPLLFSLARINDLPNSMSLRFTQFALCSWTVFASFDRWNRQIHSFCPHCSRSTPSTFAVQLSLANKMPLMKANASANKCLQYTMYIHPHPAVWRESMAQECPPMFTISMDQRHSIVRTIFWPSPENSTFTSASFIISIRNVKNWWVKQLCHPFNCPQHSTIDDSRGQFGWKE